MKSCGLIVEYNPFHNGHLLHVEQSKKVTDADCIIAVMSGSFLQRGEPAIIDKYHRAKAALKSGVDIVLELPYAFAVQSSELFAKGSVRTLQAIGADTLCFGSESGQISDFTTSYHILKKKESKYNEILKIGLNKGDAFPEASRKAYHQIGLTNQSIDLSKPNNILGFSYVKTILDNKIPIQPFTIKRIASNYHDTEIKSFIASATSIREQLKNNTPLTNKTLNSMPKSSIDQLYAYKNTTQVWHDWEKYFHLIYYRVLTMTPQELATIYGVDEGIEYRIIETIKNAVSFKNWIASIKTKRYTWTRIQRMFVHILTNTKREDMNIVKDLNSVPYIRLLGLSDTGRRYLNTYKKKLDVPIVTSIKRDLHPLLQIEERATNAYYSILNPKQRKKLHHQELQPPIMVNR